MADAAPDRALSQEQLNTAMRSPTHLKQWLDVTHRRWLVFNAMELMDALPWPSGVEAFMQVVMAYRDHRRTIDSGRTELVEEPLTGEMVEVPACKDENLEVEELDRAIRYLVWQIREKMPGWSLERTPL
jgi:SAM-dependent MidA family methyltransferase